MNLLCMATLVPALAVRDDDDGLTNLLYILVVLVFPLLGSLGAWLRKRFGKQTEELVGDLEGSPQEELILLPPSPALRPAIPQARPTTPDRPIIVMAPTPPPVRPVAEPVFPWGPPQSQSLSTPPPVLARKPKAPARVHRPRTGLQREVPEVRATGEPPVPQRRTELGVLTREDLRRAILLREVLGPPAALRPPGEASWER